MFLPVFFRNLRHPHIVQFYGATFREVPRGLEAVFLTEQCGESLKTYLVEHSRNNPADYSLTVAPAVLRWAQQIVDALMVVYSKGYVHGDLRLANVLVSQGLVFVICLLVCLFVILLLTPLPRRDLPGWLIETAYSRTKKYIASKVCKKNGNRISSRKMFNCLIMIRSLVFSFSSSYVLIPPTVNENKRLRAV